MASLGSLYFDIKFNSDPKELEEMKQNVLKQLAELEVKFGINPSISKEQLVNDINQVLNEKFKLNLLVDKEEVNNAINDAYNSAQKSTRSANQEDIGYVEDLLLKLKELEIQYKKLEKGGDTTPIIQSYKELKAELDDYGKNLANATKRQDLAEGSIVSLRAELSKLIREYDQLGKAGRESDIGQGLLQNIQKTTIALNEAEQASMRYQRNVGNYKSTWNGLQFQLQQLGRELPSIAYGANIFFAAISNNLPMFTDEVKKAQLEYKSLKEAQKQGMMLDQKAVPVWKQLVSGIFSWQTAIVAVVTVLTLYGAKMVEAISKTLKFGDSLKLAGKEIKNINKELSSAIGKELAQLDNLFGKLKNAKEGTAEWGDAKSKIIKQYGDILGGMSSEISSLSDVTAAYNELTKAIYEKAKAQAKEKIIGEYAGKMVEKSLTEYESILSEIEKVYGKTTEGSKGAVLFQKIQEQLESTGELSKEVREQIEKDFGKPINVAMASATTGSTGLSVSKSDVIEKSVSAIVNGQEKYNNKIKETDKLLSNLYRNNEKETILNKAYWEDQRSALQARLEGMTAEVAAGKEGLELRKKIKEIDKTLESYDTKKKKDEDKTLNDPLIERLKLLKDANNMYKEWSSLIGKDKAVGIVQSELLPDFNPDEYRKKIEDVIKKAGAGKKGRSVKIEAAKMLTEIDEVEARESIAKSIASIEDYIYKESKKWNLYKTIFKTTGRKDIAEALAFDGIKKSVNSYVKELESTISGLAGDVNLGSLFGLSDKDLADKFGEKSSVIKTLLKELRNAMSEEVKDENSIYIESLNTTMSYYDKRIKIIEEYARKIEIANKKGDSITAGKLASERDSKLLEIDPNTILFYTAILSLTKSQAVDIANNLKAGLVKQMEAGVISAEEFSDTLDKINRQLDASRKNAGALSSYMKEGADGLMKWFSDTGSSYQQKGASDYKVAQEDYLRYLSEFNDAMKLGDTMSANIAQNGMDMSNSSMESANGMMKMGEGMQNFASKAQGALQMVDMIVTAIDQGVKAMQQLVDSFAELAESRGIDTDEGNWANVKGYMGIMSEFNEKTKASWDSFKSGDAAGATSNLISSWVGFFSGLNRLGDRKLDKEIEKSALEVERMRDAYDEIERTLNRVFGGGSSLHKKQRDLLKGQLAELEKQKRLEEEKKDTDQKKIDDYNRQISETRDQIKYFAEDLANELYGIDLKGWASQLGDALFEAWKKGEDGATAFKQKAAEIMGDVMNEILKIQILEPMMEDVRIALFGKDGDSGYFGKDYMLDESEMKGLVKILMDGEKKSEAYYQALDQLNDYMEKNYGVSLKDKEAKRDGLTSGIKGVTEDTASLIASYMNAIRADGAKRTSLFETLINDRIPEINVFAKAQLAQMQQIATNTGKNASMAEEIRDLFSAVITGTKSIKVT